MAERVVSDLAKTVVSKARLIEYTAPEYFSFTLGEYKYSIHKNTLGGVDIDTTGILLRKAPNISRVLSDDDLLYIYDSLYPLAEDQYEKETSRKEQAVRDWIKAL